MAIITTAIAIKSNYHTLKNFGSDVIVINKITPPAWVHEGYLLHLEWDASTKGGGIFLKNKIDADSTGNLRLEAFTLANPAGEFAMTTKISQNSGTSQYGHVVKHIVNALQAIVAANTTNRNDAVTAAVAALTIEVYDPEVKRRVGAFAYGLGGATFLAGFAREDVQSSVSYFDYSPRHPYVVLMWNGTEWQQVSLSINAIS